VASPDNSVRATSRDLLIETAERLFAERGIDAVSLRSVMAAAGTNVAAVHYHFGSKDALVEALIQSRSGEVGRRREPLLQRVEALPHPTARDLAEAFVRPVAEMALGGNDGWVRFVHGVLVTRHPAFEVLDATFAPQAIRIGKVLERVSAGLDLVTARFRLAEAMTMTFRVLGDLDAVARAVQPSGGRVSDDVLVEQLVDAVTAVLAGPPA
jgi:AcrR family transcriptional regulator